MQLLPRYLVNNRTTIITNEAGFVTEYRPVYSRQIQIYKGIDNVLQFKVLNADQKAISLDSYTPKLQVFDNQKRLVIEHNGTNLSTKGLFTVTITANDLLNIDHQYMSYNIHLVDTNGDATLTYSESHFAQNGIMYISDDAFPGPAESVSVTTFLEDNGLPGQDDSVWLSSTISAEPAINGNEALHTAVVYTDSYIGNIIVQATLDNEIIGGTDWADVATLTFNGSESEPTPVNFNGVFNHLRFKATSDPANKISKILVRN